MVVAEVRVVCVGHLKHTSRPRSYSSVVRATLRHPASGVVGEQLAPSISDARRIDHPSSSHGGGIGSGKKEVLIKGTASVRTAD